MKFIKPIILVLALALPIGIFVFLKIFGKNQFDVPQFHQDRVVGSAECKVDYSTPYVVHDSVLAPAQIEANSFVVINFGRGEEIRNLEGDYERDNVSFVNVTDSVFSNIDFVRSCVLLLQEPNDIVVIDPEGRIRGYYNSADREEVDRLDLEMKILLKKY